MTYEHMNTIKCIIKLYQKNNSQERVQLTTVTTSREEHPKNCMMALKEQEQEQFNKNCMMALKKHSL